MLTPKAWLDLADDLDNAPHPNFFWPMQRGELNGMVAAMRGRSAKWQSLPARFRQAFYRRFRHWMAWQLEKAAAEVAERDPNPRLKMCKSPPTYDKPAPDAPAVTS